MVCRPASHALRVLFMRSCKNNDDETRHHTMTAAAISAEYSARYSALPTC